MTKPEIIRSSALSVQVCVPNNYSDSQIINFVESRVPCGTQNGWFIRKDPKLLDGDPERNPCSDFKGFVHVTLDA